MSADPVLVLAGATATGKSALALRLAAELDGEIVNADALQVYRGLDLGTAKPSREERLRVPHHLIDILPPAATFSAGEFSRRAREAIAEIQARGRRPLVVGGSGFYQRALLDGLGPLPESDPEVRRRLTSRLREEGLASLCGELSRVDPESAARLAPSDRQRVLRALEVWHVTGEPLSRWQQRAAELRRPLAALRIGLTLPRALLYDRIARRVRQMIAAGWIDEVRALLASGVPPTAPAFQAIGYRQLVAHLRGELGREAAVDETIRATQRYAKRQGTWFRKETEIVWFEAGRDELIADEVLRYLQRPGVERR